MAQKYIQSTCGQDQVFVINDAVDPKSDQAQVTVRQEIVIKGGIGVINKDSMVPKVMRTPVTDEELEALMKLQPFLNMKKRGFFQIITENETVYDAHGKVSGQQERDNTSQIKDTDHAAGTDPRCDHAGTRASFGERNENGGDQPVNREANYGEILL